MGFVKGVVLGMGVVDIMKVVSCVLVNVIAVLSVFVIFLFTLLSTYVL